MPVMAAPPSASPHAEGQTILLDLLLSQIASQNQKKVGPCLQQQTNAAQLANELVSNS